MRTVLITGGSRSIGRATAIEFAKAGYRVIIGYFSSQDKAYELQNEYGITAVKFDVSIKEQVSCAIKQIRQEFGKIDTLVNCAGVAPKQMLFDEIDDNEYQRTFDVNVKGIFNVTKEVVSDMISLKSGAIVNVSSIWGLDGASCEALYSATKGAVTAFTKSLAKELAPSNIRVNEVAPGFIDTDMNAHISNQDKQAFCQGVMLERLGKAEEVAKAILFLASDDASYITGQTLRVDGGII